MLLRAKVILANGPEFESVLEVSCLKSRSKLMEKTTEETSNNIKMSKNNEDRSCFIFVLFRLDFGKMKSKIKINTGNKIIINNGIIENS